MTLQLYYGKIFRPESLYGFVIQPNASDQGLVLDQWITVRKYRTKCRAKEVYSILEQGIFWQTMRVIAPQHQSLS